MLVNRMPHLKIKKLQCQESKLLFIPDPLTNKSICSKTNLAVVKWGKSKEFSSIIIIKGAFVQEFIPKNVKIGMSRCKTCETKHA